ncbi:MAG: MFS transporter [Myxococcales bacterium]|nr:MFS transporter [Myxococcales bacterium]
MSDEPGSTPAAGAPVGHRRALLTVWFTLFLDLVSFGLIIPVLPFYAEHFGAPVWMVTLLSTVFSLAQFVMSPILGRLSDRHGRRRIMLLSIAGAALSMLVLGLATSLWMVFLARLINGCCNANIATAHAYVADRVPPGERARYMGMMGAAIGIGFVVGPIVGGFLALPTMPELPFLVAAGLSTLNFLMALVWLPESHRPGRTAEALAAPVRRNFLALLGRDLRGTQIGVLALVAFGFFTAFSNMESSFALFTEVRYGWGARETGAFFTFIGVMIAVMQGVVVGRAVRRLGERRTLLTGMVLMAAGLMIQGAVPSVVAIFAGGALIAGGNGLMNPSLNALISRASSADDQGLNMGLVQSASSLGRISGPALAGPLFELITPGAPLIFASCLILFVLASVGRLIRDPEAGAAAA